MPSDSQTFVENALASVLLIAIFCPSPLRLLWLYIQRYRGTQFHGTQYEIGLVIHLINSVLSPGLPVYMFFQWSKCGPGCGSGVVLIFFLPVIWALFFWGNWKLSHSKGPPEPPSNQPQVNAAVLAALEQVREGQPVTQLCPACLSQVTIKSSLQGDAQQMVASCKCGMADGTYEFSSSTQQSHDR